MTEKVIAFPPPGEYLTLNKMPGTARAAKAHRALKNEWKEAAFWAAVQAFGAVGPSGRQMPPSDVYLSFPVTTNRTRDPGNWTLTTKPIIDGFVEAGMWPDDGPDYVTEHLPAFRIVDSPAEVIVRVVPR